MRAANHVLPSAAAAERFGARSREAITCYLETGNPAFQQAAVYYATQAASFVPATDYECAECENVYDTLKEAEACCTVQGALIEDEPERPAHRRLTREERLQGIADSGIDTWREYEEAYGDLD